MQLTYQAYNNEAKAEKMTCSTVTMYVYKVTMIRRLVYSFALAQMELVYV